MTESEIYWITLVEELVAITKPLRGGHELASDEPAWVDKLTFEMFNMVAPKMQLRAGNKPTPDKIGVMIGSYLVLAEQMKALQQVPKPTTESGRAAYYVGNQLAIPPNFSNGAELMQRHWAGVEQRIQSVIARVLRERSSSEAAEFHKGLGRGLTDKSRSIVPQIENGQPKYTAKQFELIRRVMVYMLARHRWREIEKLETSQQAFEWFEKLLPPQILGNDPERIRKMFYRVGKKFKTPGRPKKGTRSA